MFGVLYLSASCGRYILDVLHPTRYVGTSSVPACGVTGVAGVKAHYGWVRIDMFGAWERDESWYYLLFYQWVMLVTNFARVVLSRSSLIC